MSSALSNRFVHLDLDRAKRLVLSNVSAQSQLEMTAASMVGRWLLIESDELKVFGQLPDLTEDDDRKNIAFDPSPILKKFMLDSNPMSYLQETSAIYISKLHRWCVADGILSWTANSGHDGAVSINHPLLLKRVELRFNPNIPEFTIHETDREVELYTSLFLDLKNVESAAIRNRKIELETAAYHPLGWDDTSSYLRSVAITLSPTDGEFLEEPSDGQKTHPRIWRQPVLLLRKRVAGLGNAVDRIIDDIDAQAVFPPSISQITGG